MVETVETFDGWYALHDFRTIKWEKWQQASKKTDRIGIISRFIESMARYRRQQRRQSRDSS